LRPRLYAAARFAGSAPAFNCRMYKRGARNLLRSWGLRPRLYAAARFAGSAPDSAAEMYNRVARNVTRHSINYKHQNIARR